jgi:hypothetical protein
MGFLPPPAGLRRGLLRLWLAGVVDASSACRHFIQTNLCWYNEYFYMSHIVWQTDWFISLTTDIETFLDSCSNIYPTRCNVTQFILYENYSTCFAWYHHPSSGKQTAVSTASDICHTVTAICRYRERVGTDLNLLWVAYATQQHGPMNFEF